MTDYRMEVFERAKTMTVVQRNPDGSIECPNPDCHSKSVEARYYDFTPNHKVLEDVFICCECNTEFILETPSVKSVSAREVVG